jgi:hypothetical protein
VPHIDVVRVDKLVLVEDVVLDRRADELDAARLRFDQEATSGVHVDLRVVGVLDVVVGHLKPTSFDVEVAGCAGDVE